MFKVLVKFIQINIDKKLTGEIANGNASWPFCPEIRIGWKKMVVFITAFIGINNFFQKPDCIFILDFLF